MSWESSYSAKRPETLDRRCSLTQHSLESLVFCWGSMAPERAEADSPLSHPLSHLQAAAAHVCSEAGARWNDLVGCANEQRRVAQNQASHLLDSLVRTVRQPLGAQQGRARPLPALAVRLT